MIYLCDRLMWSLVERISRFTVHFGEPVQFNSFFQFSTFLMLNWTGSPKCTLNGSKVNPLDY